MEILNKVEILDLDLNKIYKQQRNKYIKAKIDEEIEKL
jgi:hypothetical protein